MGKGLFSLDITILNNSKSKCDFCDNPSILEIQIWGRPIKDTVCGIHYAASKIDADFLGKERKMENNDSWEVWLYQVNASVPVIPKGWEPIGAFAYLGVETIVLRKRIEPEQSLSEYVKERTVTKRTTGTLISELNAAEVEAMLEWVERKVNGIIESNKTVR